MLSPFPKDHVFQRTGYQIKIAYFGIFVKEKWFFGAKISEGIRKQVEAKGKRGFFSLCLPLIPFASLLSG